MQLQWHKELGSTQDRVLGNADVLEEYEVVVAHTQTSGYGRRGTRWYSNSGSLTFSFRLSRNGCGSEVMMSVAEVVKRTLDEMGVPGTRIKWPNDLHIRARSGMYKKICGIMVSHVERGGGQVCVVGIGINMHGTEGSYSSIEEECGVRLCKLEFLGRFISQLRLGSRETRGASIPPKQGEDKNEDPETEREPFADAYLLDYNGYFHREKEY
jgi:biotin-[acetyl-CoA-carboxylase] ligase BirA-like protein